MARRRLHPGRLTRSRPAAERMVWLVVAAIVAAAGVGSAGCAPARVGGTMSPDAVIEELRQEKLALTRDLQAARESLALRDRQVAALQQRLATTRPAVEGVAAGDLPHLADVELDPLSGAVTDSAGKVAMRLYVRTLDQHGRFLVVAGKAEAQAVAIRPGRPPLVVAQRRFRPADLHAAYRTGLTGTHYTLELPLAGAGEGAEPVKEVTVKIVVTDAATGVTATTERSMPLPGAGR